MAEKIYTLKYILVNLVSRADSARMVYVHVRLKNGLSIQVMREPERYLLDIFRPGVEPSMT